jgi:hypothetical protein
MRPLSGVGFLLVFACGLAVAWSAVVAGPACAALQLSEMLADPARDWDGDGEVNLRDDEWLEVTNTGPGWVDLSEYWVRDALGDEPHLNLQGTLGPGDVALFFGSDAVLWQQGAGYATTGLSFNNAGDEISLWRGDPLLPEAQMVDMYIYADHEAEDDRSSGRLHLDGEWALFDGLNPYTGAIEPLSTGCSPSPGVLNDCTPEVRAEGVSWGWIKNIYR